MICKILLSISYCYFYYYFFYDDELLLYIIYIWTVQLYIRYIYTIFNIATVNEDATLYNVKWSPPKKKHTAASLCNP